MKLIKKFTALLLAVTFSIGLMPATVFANKQAPVNSLTITAGNTASTGNVYTLRLRWNKPVPSGSPDVGSDGGGYHQISNVPGRESGYNIQYRDVTTNSNSTFLDVPGYDNFVDYADLVDIEFPIELQPARTYEFRVRPYHTHTNAIAWNEAGIATDWETVLAVIDDDPAFTDLRVLFFTDIVVEKPEAAGSAITVSWSAPRFANQRVFNNYIFYWTNDTNVPINISNANVFSSSVVDVRVSDGVGYTITESVIGGMLRYTCTFAAGNLDVNRDYTLVVEPALNNRRWRDQQSVGTPGMALNPNSELFRFDTRPSDAPRNGRYEFQHSPTNRREYRSSEFRVRLALNEIISEGDNSIRISWDPGMIGSNDRPIYIYMTEEENGLGQQIGFLGEGSTGINFWITEKPKKKVWYYITLGGPDDGSGSEDRKSVPQPYDPEAESFRPYSPVILSIDSSQTGISAQLFWKAFLRNIYDLETESSSEFALTDEYGTKKILDLSVSYDIYVSDSLDELNSSRIEGFMYSASRVDDAKVFPASADTSSSDWTWAYDVPIGEYYNSQTLTLEPLVANRVYYVRIVARRGSDTAPAYGSFFIPGDAPTNPQMMARPPLKLGPQKTDMDTIYISWRTIWNEVYNDHGNIPPGNTAMDEGWYSNVGWNAAGGTYDFGNTLSLDVKMYSLETEEFFTSSDFKYPLARRVIDVSRNTDFYVHVVEFDTVLEQFSTASDPSRAYLEYITDDPDAVWEKLENIAQYRSGDGYINVPLTGLAGGGAIKENTAYVVFFRPIGTDGKAASYPSYITCVTPDRIPSLIVQPTVPTIYVDTAKTTARSITVYWEMSPEFEYTLVYGDLMSQYPAGGTTISFADIKETGDLVTRPGSWTYEVAGLFGLTEYYFWIRSEAPSAPNAPPPSNWSNPVSEMTKDIDAPDPPQGLGPASRDLIDEYNAQISDDLRPIGADYMFIQWMRLYDDDTDEGTSASNGDAARVDPDALPENTYLALFGSLIANREYHIRAKTIYTMIRSGTEVKTQYSYLVQLADNDEFIDAWEIYIPALDSEPALKRDMIRKESEWTTTLRLKTSTSSDDYDGEWDARMYPLPVSDFEITYNSTTGELKYRFRSMGVAEDGTHDNSVDQRFISRMIRDRVYIYTLDLTSYGGNNIRKRTIEIPFSIVRAMDERNVSLRFAADNATLTIAPGSLLTPETVALSDFAATQTSVSYSLDQNHTSVPARIAGDEYASVPQTLTVTVNTPTRTINMTNLGQNIEVAMKLGARYTPYDRHVAAYYADSNTPGWISVKNTYNNVAGTMTISTGRIGSYSAIAKPLPVSISGQGLPDSVYTVTTHLNIIDMPQFNPGQPINASQFNNIVAAIARNSTSVAVYDSMSQADFNALGRSGILVTGTEVTREAGIHALVRLYELKTNRTVTNFGSVASSPYSDIASASPQYQVSLLKAARLGFFNSLSTNPRGILTMGDAFEMFGFVIEDAEL